MASADLPYPLRGAAARALPPRARAFVAAVVVASAAALALCAALAPQALGGGWGEVWQPVALTAALILTEGFETRLPLGRHFHTVSPADAALAVGLFWLPAPLVVLAAGLGALISQQLAGGSPLKRVATTARYTLATAAAAAVAVVGMAGAPGVHFPRATVSRLPQLVPPVTSRWCLTVLVAMAVFFAVNHTLAALLTTAAGGPGMRETWWRSLPPAVAHWAANTSNGVLGAVLLVGEPLLLPLVLGSVALTSHSSRAWASSLAIRERSRLLADAGRALADHLSDPLPTRPGVAAQLVPLARQPAGRPGASPGRPPRDDTGPDPARDLDTWQPFVTMVARALDCEGAAIFLARPGERVLDVFQTTGTPARLPSAGTSESIQAAALAHAATCGWSGVTLTALEADGTALGHLAVFGLQEKPALGSEGRELLDAFAGQAGSALRNEDLYRAAEAERVALQDIVGHSTDGIYTVAPDRTVRSWNPAMAAITGWSAEEAVGRKCYDLLRARDGKGNYTCVSACPIQAAAAAGSEVVRDASILTRDRDTRWINYAHAPILHRRSGRMETDVVVVRDVTRERRTEEAKADFVANISHELRSPLTPIKGFLLTLLREDRWFAEERRRDYYRLMLGQTERLEALIEDLLDVTRVETGVGVLHATSVDAKRVVAEAVARFAEANPGRRVEVTIPEEPVTARANLLRTQQVLGHLLSNADRYSPAGSPVNVELRAEGDEVSFQVRDAGPGIPADEQTRIFERFHRGGYYMTREPGGAGLGLYLAKRLVEAMGGRIWVESTLGHGSTFSFALRAVPVSTLEALRKRHRCAG